MTRHGRQTCAVRTEKTETRKNNRQKQEHGQHTITMAYFIRIEDGPDTRRKLLESSKATLHILRGYQELLRVRSEKATLMNQLRREMKEVTVLLNRLESDMPILTEREMAEFNPLPQQPERPQAASRTAKEEARSSAKPKKTDVYVAMPKREVTSEVSLPKQNLTPATQAPEKPVARMTELERLEAQLEKINSRLGQL